MKSQEGGSGDTDEERKGYKKDEIGTTDRRCFVLDKVTNGTARCCMRHMVRDNKGQLEAPEEIPETQA